MAKKKNKKNKKSKKINVFPIALGIIVAAILCFVSFKFFIFIKGMDNFKVENISCLTEDYPALVNKIKSIKGRNIFSLDLDYLERRLINSFPGIYQVRLLREFPDEVIIDYKKRIPLAKLYYGNKYYFIDKEAVVLPYRENFSQGNLSIIRGIKIKPDKLKTGRAISGKNFRLALYLVSELNSVNEFFDFIPLTIDISNNNNIVFYLDKVEIRIGLENQKERLGILRILLRQPDIDLGNIKYIDLRFKEPIVGKK